MNPLPAVLLALLAFVSASGALAQDLFDRPTLRAAVVHSDEVCYAVGDDGAIFASPPANLTPHWYRVGSGVPYTLRAIATSGARLVAVGDRGLVG